MLIGPSTELPVLLSKTSRPVFTIWTYCVSPTSPFVSGGAQLQLTPGKSMPSKLSSGLGIFGGAGLLWTTVSFWFVCAWAIARSGTACFAVALNGIGVMLRSAGEVSFLTECPTSTWLPLDAIEPVCEVEGFSPCGPQVQACGPGVCVPPAAAAVIVEITTADRTKEATKSALDERQSRLPDVVDCLSLRIGPPCLGVSRCIGALREAGTLRGSRLAALPGLRRVVVRRLPFLRLGTLRDRSDRVVGLAACDPLSGLPFAFPERNRHRRRR